jgi:hypothetical protein
MGLFQFRQDPPATATIAISCPECGNAAVASKAQQIDERILLLYFLPLLKTRNTFITCGACERSLAVGATSLEDLQSLTPEQIKDRLQPYTPFIGRLLVILALLLFWFPFASPLMAVGGLLLVRRSRRWRMWAIAAVVLSSLVAIAVACLLIFGSH